MKNYLRLIDHNTDGTRCDVTPIFAAPVAFAQLVDDLIMGLKYDIVAGIDALGFILGSAIAVKAGVGFIPVRKGGKLPVPALSRTFCDYSGAEKSLEIRADHDLPGKNILLVDEWIETGAQVRAAISLLEQKGAELAAIATINIDDNPGTAWLLERYCVRAGNRMVDDQA